MGRHAGHARAVRPGRLGSGPGPGELYYLPDDFSQAHDVAAEHPDKVQELKELFWEEAERNQVLPLLGGLSMFFGILPPIADKTTSSSAGTCRTCCRG